MKPDHTITVDEWRAELGRVMGRSDDAGMTARELAAAMGLSDRTTLLRLRGLAEAGSLGVGRRSSTTIHGRASYTPVYWLKPVPKAGTGKPKGGTR